MCLSSVSSYCGHIPSWLWKMFKSKVSHVAKINTKGTEKYTYTASNMESRVARGVGAGRAEAPGTVRHLLI